MDIINYINPELIVLVPVLYVLGLMIKDSIATPNTAIPAILGGVGVLLAVAWCMATVQPVGLWAIVLTLVTAVIQGVLCAGAAVYADQLGKQSAKAKAGDTVSVPVAEVDNIAKAMGVSGKELGEQIMAAKKKYGL
mgnify:CR=1 FL=1